MTKKLTFEEVKERYAKKGFELLEYEYINNQTPMLCKTKEGYLRKIKLVNLNKDTNRQIFGQKNPFTLYNIKLWLHKINPDIELLTDRYVSNKVPLQFRCRICGEVFTKTINALHRSQELICPQCWENPKKLDIEFVQQAFLKHGLTLLEFDYQANNKPLLCVDQEGYYSRVAYVNLDKGDKYRRFSWTYNQDCYLQNVRHFCEINQYTIRIVDVVDFTEQNEPIMLAQCECGNYFKITIGVLSKGRYWCGNCLKNKSSYERIVEIWLQEHNIVYSFQHRFEDCKDKRHLPFDFYIPNKNILIEVDGEQHFKEIEFYRVKDKTNLEYTQYHDSLKNQYCQDNGFTLIRIPYTQFNDKTYLRVLEQNLL